MAMNLEEMEFGPYDFENDFYKKERQATLSCADEIKGKRNKQ